MWLDFPPLLTAMARRTDPVQHSDTPQFSSTHKDHTQMEHLFVFAPGVVQYII